MLVKNTGFRALAKYVPLGTSDLSWSMYSGPYKKADWWCRTPNYSNTTFMGNVTLVLKV